MEATVKVTASDAGDASPWCRVVDVTCNETCEGDTEITGDLTVDLRAERDGKGSGRVYTLHIACADASGNTSTTTVEGPDRGE